MGHLNRANGLLAITFALLTLGCVVCACTRSENTNAPAPKVATNGNTPAPANEPAPDHPEPLPTGTELDRAAEDIINQRACRTCHRPDEVEEEGAEATGNAATLAPPLARIAERRPLDWIRRFLRYPYAIRKNQFERMLDLQLSDREIEILVSYMQRKSADNLKKLTLPGPTREAKPRRPRVLTGRRLFVKYNCMNCHSLGKHQIRIQRDDEGNVVFQHGALQAPDLTNVWQRTRPEWLLATIKHAPDWMPWSRMPDLEVKDIDAEDLAWYLMNAIESPTTEVAGQQVADILNQRCASCHNSTDPARELDLSTLEGLQKGAINDLGQPRPTVVPYAENSPLLYHLNGKKYHPKLEAANKPTELEYKLLEEWVLAGAPN